MNRLTHLLVLTMLIPLQSTAQSRLSADGVEAIDAYLADAIERTDIPGLVAMVTNQDGTLYSGAFGAQDVGQGRPMTTQSIFRIASMTKPITSFAVMMLIDEGLVGLDGSISSYLPDLVPTRVFENFDSTSKTYTSRPASGPVTVRHLLTHTSGIGYSFSNEILFQLVGGQSPPPNTLEYPLLHDPGTRWTYGQSTRVLGTLVERVSGETVDAFMAERIFAPLGMSETGYRVADAQRHRVAATHERTEQGLVESPNPKGAIRSAVRGDGGLFSTAADYSKFMRMILNEGRAPDGTRLLSAETVRLMMQNHTGEVRVELQPAADTSRSRPFPLGAGRDGFGLGFQITGLHDGTGSRSPGSGSWAGIYNTQFWIDPEAGIGAVLLMQYLPFYDAAAIETLRGFEQRVYAHLR